MAMIAMRASVSHAQGLLATISTSNGRGRLDEAPRRIIRSPLWIGLVSTDAKRYAGYHPLPGLDTRGDRFIVLAG